MKDKNFNEDYERMRTVCIAAFEVCSEIKSRYSKKAFDIMQDKLDDDPEVIRTLKDYDL